MHVPEAQLPYLQQHTNPDIAAYVKFTLYAAAGYMEQKFAVNAVNVVNS